MYFFPSISRICGLSIKSYSYQVSVSVSTIPQGASLLELAEPSYFQFNIANIAGFKQVFPQAPNPRGLSTTTYHCARNYPSYHPPPLYNPATLAFSKLPKVTFLTIYQLSTDHLWSISNWISTLPGLWVVIIRINNSVRLDQPTGTELGNINKMVNLARRKT